MQARTLMTAIAALPLIVGPGPAAAQQPDTTVADTAKVPLYRLEGITVTVTRSRSEINRLPFAVSLLGADQIQALKPAISLQESLIEVPGVVVNNRYNFALGDRISIRGFGSRTQFGVRGIRILQDGIPLTLPDGQSQTNNLDLGAAGRIEVIRGPASSLYGNASGGVISVETENPPPATLQPRLELLGGGFGNDRFYQKYDLKGGGRAGSFDYLAHLSHLRSDGYRLHSAAEYTQFNTRVRFYPDDRSDVTAVVNYVNSPQAQNPSTLTDSLARVKPDTARDLVLAPGECPPDPGFGGCQDLGETSKQGQAGLRYRRLLGAGHEISLMGYGLFRELDNPIPFTLIQLDRKVAGGRAEYRYRPAGGTLALAAGFDTDFQADDRREFDRDDTGVGDATLDQDERVTALGVFAQARWLFAPAWELSASVRYDRVRFHVDDRLVGGGDPDDSGTMTLEPDILGLPLSPMVGLTYAAAPWLNVYANLGTSFQTPTTTELTDTLGGFNQSLKPEQAVNYELGFKGTAADRVSYSLALFLANIDDQLIGFQAGGGERVLFVNAGSSEHKGVETSLSALLSPQLTLSAAYTYSNFDFEDFATDDGDFAGNDVPGIPLHQLFGRLAYTHSSGLRGQVELETASSYFVDNANEVKNDAYGLVHFRLGYAAIIRNLGIEPFLGINNLFDRRYNSSVVVNAFGGRFFEPAPGRNIYLGVRLDYR